MKLPDPKSGGKFCIQPIDQFYENGHFWMVKKVYPLGRKRLEGYSWENRAVELFWDEENATIEVVDCGTMSLGQDNACQCADCLSGRKKVKKGWKPCLA